MLNDFSPNYPKIILSFLDFVKIKLCGFNRLPRHCEWSDCQYLSLQGVKRRSNLFNGLLRSARNDVIPHNELFLFNDVLPFMDSVF